MTLASGSRGGPPGLDAHTRSLVRVAIAVATGDTAVLKERLVAARGAKTPEGWVDELLLQSLLNVGYALGLQAFAVWREVSPAPGGSETLSHEAWRAWAERGARVCGAGHGRTHH